MLVLLPLPPQTIVPPEPMTAAWSCLRPASTALPSTASQRPSGCAPPALCITATEQRQRSSWAGRALQQTMQQLQRSGTQDTCGPTCGWAGPTCSCSSRQRQKQRFKGPWSWMGRALPPARA